MDRNSTKAKELQNGTSSNIEGAIATTCLDYLRTRRRYKRNRVIILLTHYAMLRVGEVAALRYCDVFEADGQIKAETTLTASQIKGKRGRKIWFTEKVRAELAAYAAAHKPMQLTQPLLYTQHCE